jgi:hypothetical protein
VTALLLAKKYIRGQIPHDLGQLTNWTSLSMSVNQLSATILSSLGALTAMKILWLNDKQLVGTKPFCNSDQSFGYLVADCMEVNCTCCTHCGPVAFGDTVCPNHWSILVHLSASYLRTFARGAVQYRWFGPSDSWRQIAVSPKATWGRCRPTYYRQRRLL